MTANLSGGEILLLHDSDCYSSPRSWQATVDALPPVFERIAENGLRAVALDHDRAGY